MIHATYHFPFLYLLCLIITSSFHFVISSDNVRHEKRSLYGLADHDLFQPISSFQHLPQPTLASTNLDLIAPTAFSNNIFHDINYQSSSPASQFPLLSSFPTYGSPIISNNALTQVDDEPHYYHDGRLLKQYSVKEDHEENREQELFNFFQTPGQYHYQGQQNDLQFFFDNLNPSFRQGRKFSTTLNKNHGPIALGSGSLGYITLPNGSIYLGSGSLGYISHKEHMDNIDAVKMKRVLTPGPLSFGHNHKR